MLDQKNDETSKKRITTNESEETSYEKNIEIISKELNKILGLDLINRKAKESKFIERRRNYDGYEAFWSLVGGFLCGHTTEIAGMLRSFCWDTGKTLQYNAWYKRLEKPGFPLFMQEMCSHLMSHLYQDQIDFEGSCLSEFRDVYIQDGSSFAVNDLLEEFFPGRFTTISPAAVEVHPFYSLRHNTFEYLHVAGDTVSEYEFMPTEADYLENTLSLFDRGYASIDRLHEIEKSQGYFVARFKDNTTPKILKVHRGDSRLPSHFEGKALKNITLKKRDYDFSVSYKSKNEFKYLRLIALWNQNTKKHIFFVTNAGVRKLALKNIGEIYRLRWQIELLFKELKSHTELRKFLTGNKHIAEGFIWAAFCALMIRRFLVSSAQKSTDKKIRLSFHKAAVSANDFMKDFVACALNKFLKIDKCLMKIFDYLIKTMRFSNKKRPSTFDKVGLSVCQELK